MEITNDQTVERLIDDLTDRFAELVTVPQNQTGERTQKMNASLDLIEALHKVVEQHQHKVESGHYHDRNEQWLREAGCK